MTQNLLYAWKYRNNVSDIAFAELIELVRPEIVRNNEAVDEASTQQRIRITAAQHKLAMWRNNNGAMVNGEGRAVRFGLGNDSKKLSKVWKSADLIGIGPGGRFVACEVKHPDWVRPMNDRDRAQETMLTQVNALGGIGFFANSVFDYKRKVLDL